MSSSKNYHIDAEPDLGGKTNRLIWIYFILLGVMLFVTIGGLTIMYRFQVDYEYTEKIGAVKSRERVEYDARAQRFLSGELGVFSDKKHVPIDVAMGRFLKNVREVQ